MPPLRRDELEPRLYVCIFSPFTCSLFMYLFYNPELQPSEEPQRGFLSEEESQHCVRVLRYTAGDQLLLTNGKGYTFNARVVNPHPRHCEFEVISSALQQKSHDFFMHLAVAPTKNIERMEWLVEKATEIGVDRITPLLCRFSERRQIRTDRLEKIILSAAKQSLTPYLPVLDPLTDVEQLIAQATEQTRFIAHCYETDKRQLKDNIVRGASCLVLIGPEGDFSQQEVELALCNGFLPVSLGNSRLRTETAGIVACHTAVLVNS